MGLLRDLTYHLFSILRSVRYSSKREATLFVPQPVQQADRRESLEKNTCQCQSVVDAGILILGPFPTRVLGICGPGSEFDLGFAVEHNTHAIEKRFLVDPQKLHLSGLGRSPIRMLEERLYDVPLRS